MPSKPLPGGVDRRLGAPFGADSQLDRLWVGADVIAMGFDGRLTNSPTQCFPDCHRPMTILHLLCRESVEFGRREPGDGFGEDFTLQALIWRRWSAPR